MKHYLEETLKFTESEEMREYLRTRTDCLDRYTCTTAVIKANPTLANDIWNYVLNTNQDVKSDLRGVTLDEIKNDFGW